MRDGELGAFLFLEESDDGVQVNHLALTYRFNGIFTIKNRAYFVFDQTFATSEG
jgi:hypothetical protein